MDILDPFSPGKGQVKFLIVAVDYFTKWIAAKPLTTITIQQVQQFVWKDIICRYGVPHTIIPNNGWQFIDKELAKFYTGLGVTTEIAMGRRTKKIKFVKTEFGVATIVIIGNCGKP